jgi:DnaK suppressor protein
MKTKTKPVQKRPAATAEQIRDQARQLYEQSGRLPGRDLDNWLAAEAALAGQRAAPVPVPREWRAYHRSLLCMREALIGELDEHDREIRTALERGGADAVDVANDTRERDTLLSAIALEQFELAEVEAALERMGRGTYGFCEVTGRPISAARLKVLPWTRLCRAAAAAATARQAPPIR